MKKFEEQLLRLKQAVKLTADQDVAALLGMSKEAFHQRKKRDAFPDEKLFALAAKRPDLKLDAGWILMGPMRDAATGMALAELTYALAATAHEGGTVAEQMTKAQKLVEIKYAPLATDEQMLLDAYRQASAADKKSLLTFALTGLRSEGTQQGLAAPDATERKAPKQIKPKTTAGLYSTQQNFHAPIKGDVVGRDKIVSPSSPTREKIRNGKQ